MSDDKFRLGTRMSDGVLLLGRRTWEHFSRLWPTRDGRFADLMNAVPKRVATRTGIDATAWGNSEAIVGDPLTWVEQARQQGDIVVIGSLSLVHALEGADLVDEYRLLTFPAVVGKGDRLFADGRVGDFRFTHAGPSDSAAVTTLTIVRRAQHDAVSDRGQ